MTSRAHPPAIEIKDKEITLIGDAEFQLDQIEDVLRNKLTKQEVDVRFLDKGDVQKMGGDKVKVVIKVRNGIETELSKKIQRLLKDSKIKVQAAIQEEKAARHRRQARRPAGRHGADPQGNDRHSAELRQLPRLNSARLACAACAP